MRYILLITFILFNFSHEIEVSSKLDFGDDSGSSLIQTHQRNIPIKYDHVEIKKKNSGNSESKGIICGSGGCNTTNSKTDEEIVKTDVVVQVKTSIDVKNKSKVPEDVPDIPVILGTKGVGSRNPSPGIQRGLQYYPSNRRYSSNNVPIVVTNIEDAFPSLTSTLVPANLYRAQTDNGIGFKFKTLPPVVISMPDGYKHKNDGIEVKIPYFEPTYHNHYYSENSPPQIAYYPRKNYAHNPVAFNNVQRPSFTALNSWNNNAPSNHIHGNDCMCNNQNTPELHWYPRSDSQVLASNTAHKRNSGISPGLKISNKLGALN